MSETGLERFVVAQERVYDSVLAELRAGRKRSHWMWFVFPQMRGLGHSANAAYYGIESLREAQDYLAHAVLGPRLRQCVSILLDLPKRDASAIFGYPDDLKFRSSLTLFAHAAEPGNVFVRALERFFDGEPDAATTQLLEESGGNV